MFLSNKSLFARRIISLFLSSVLTLSSSFVNANQNSNNKNNQMTSSNYKGENEPTENDKPSNTPAPTPTHAETPTSPTPTLNLNGNGSIGLKQCGKILVHADFNRTKSKFEEFFKTESDFQYSTCSNSIIDKFMISTVDTTCKTKSTSGTGGCLEYTGDQTQQSTAAKYGSCKTLKDKIETQNRELLSAKQAELNNCLSQALNIRKIELANTTVDCKNFIETDFLFNENACNSVAQEVQTKSERLLAFAKEHWMWIAGLLGAVGTGAYLLMSSGKKQKDDLTTNPDQPEAAPLGPSNPIPGVAKDEPKPVEAPVATFQRPSDQPYCQNKVRPLECFITPACDLECAAARYGVNDYAGMGKDTRMIDMSGNVVDPTTARPQNPGANTNSGSLSSGGGSSKSGGNGPGELGNGGGNSESAENKPVNTRGYGNFDFDGGGGGGRGYGSGSDGDSSYGRNPAAVAAKSLQDAKPVDPAASGPILHSKENLFDHIWSVSRAQCVRDLVYCGGN